MELEIQSLLEKIVDKIDITQDTKLKQDYVNLFCERYSLNYRHSYYELSKYLESIDAEMRDNLCTNIDVLLEFASSENCYFKEEEHKRKTISGLYKLDDHLSLETIRITRLGNISHLERELKTIATKSEKMYDNVKKSTSRLEKRVNNFHSQSITILGIFSAVVIGFNAGINLLNGAFSNINNMNFYSIIVFVFTIGMSLFNILFLLLYATSKIAGVSISSTGERSTKSKSFWSKLAFKYTYVLFFNIMSLAVVALLIICKIK